MSCKSDARRDWRSEPDRCETCGSQAASRGARACKSARVSKLMGDSVLRQVAKQLGCGAGSSNREEAIAGVANPAEKEDEVFARYWRVQGPVPKRLPTIESILRDHLNNVTRGHVRGGGALVLNVGPLAGGAYGRSRTMQRGSRSHCCYPRDCAILERFALAYDGSPSHLLFQRKRRRSRCSQIIKPSMRRADRQSNYNFRLPNHVLEAGDFAAVRLRKSPQATCARRTRASTRLCSWRSRQPLVIKCTSSVAPT